MMKILQKTKEDKVPERTCLLNSSDKEHVLTAKEIKGEFLSQIPLAGPSYNQYQLYSNR